LTEENAAKAAPPTRRMAGFFIGRTQLDRLRMTLLEMRDWLGFAVGLISFLLALKPLLIRPRSRTVDRGWTLKIGWVELARHHRETDVQS
jgi:hypothetical protein